MSFETPCLIDSGLQINILFSENSLPPGNYDYMPIFFENAISLTGHDVPIKGDLFLFMKNSTTVTTERVTIIDKSFPLKGGIIGMPYLLTSGAKINFDAEAIVINDEILRQNFFNADKFRGETADGTILRHNLHKTMNRQQRETIDRISHKLQSKKSLDDDNTNTIHQFFQANLHLRQIRGILDNLFKHSVKI